MRFQGPPRAEALNHTPIHQVNNLLAELIDGKAAESTKAEGPAAIVTPQSLQDTKALTGKARLGNKWTDEQRLNNCKVPIDKRGSKTRAANCTLASPGF